MFRLFNERRGHHHLLIAVSALLFLPALGTPSLWDIDEGNNAEAAREMLESGNWIVPTFNSQLRVDKPALLYWLQLAGYYIFGVGEFAARLPSALAALLTVLLTYELGRCLFDAATALLAGLVLVSSLLFCGSAHFANPDALLNACTACTFLLFWRDFVRDRVNWLVWIGISTGLGFLAKGPVAVVLPGTVILLFLLWTRQLRRLLHWQLLLGALVWGLVALPWFALVGSETKGEYLRGFFLRHNKERFLAAMEGHSGPVYYHVCSLALGFLPWSVFLAPALWHAWRPDPVPDDSASPPRLRVWVSPCRFLLCWIAVYFVFFSISRTKLPNYVLPLYPAIALVTAHFLEQWRRGAIRPAGWVMQTSLACWALIGVGLTLGLLVAGGVFQVALLRGRHLPGMEAGAWLGVLPVVGAGAACLCWRHQARTGLLSCLAVTAVALAAALATWGGPALDAHKAPRRLVEMAQVRQPYREVRIGCYAWNQPSLVFYCQRDVREFYEESQVVDFLHSPLPVYLFIPERVWRKLQADVSGPWRQLARHWCFYTNRHVVVIANQ